MNKWALRCAVLLMAAVFGVRANRATPITFEFSGTASGTLVDTAFNDAGFVILLVSDTAKVHDLGDDIFTLAGKSSIHIEGVGDARFTVPTRVFSNEHFDVGGPGVGFSNNQPADQGDDYLDINDGAFTGYHLRGPIGPITTDSITAVEQFAGAQTTRGPLTFDTAQNVTFTATTGSVAMIPLPPAWLSALCFAGFLAIAWTIRRIAH